MLPSLFQSFLRLGLLSLHALQKRLKLLLLLADRLLKLCLFGLLDFLKPSVERSKVVLGLVQDTGGIGREGLGRGGKGRRQRVNGGSKLGDDGLLGSKLLDLGDKQGEPLLDLFDLFLDLLLLGGRRRREVVAGRGLVAERKRRTGVELLALVGRDLRRDRLWLELTGSLGVREGA